MKLFDTHCHLQASRFDDVDELWKRAVQAGVAGALCCATDPSDWDSVVRLSLKISAVKPALGVHPWYIPEEPIEAWLPRLEKRLQEIPQAWVGEIGVDRTAGPALELQERVFAPQLELAGRLGRPASLHCRRTWDRLQPFLKKRKHREVPVVLHSFSGSLDVVKSLLDLNVYFSFSAAVTRARNQRLPQVLRFVPRDRILIETDSPDILPNEIWKISPDRPNEPSLILHTLRVVSNVWNLSEEETAEILEINTLRIWEPRKEWG